MKNNKKANFRAFLHQKIRAPHFLKNFFIFMAFLVFFGVSVFLILKRYIEKPPPALVAIPQEAPLQQVCPPPPPKRAAEEISPPSASISEDLASIEDPMSSFMERLTILEERINQQQAVSQVSKLSALELIRGVLEGRVPLETLKTFLQKTPDPWAVSLMGIVTPLRKILPYAHLEILLVPSISPLESLSLWERIKRKVQSLVHIQKVDEKGECKFRNMRDVQRALQAHDIQKALEVFEKLSLEEQALLSSWKKSAQERLSLEKAQEMILLEIGKGQDL